MINIVKNVRHDDSVRGEFISLAKKVFSLSFEKWYENGYWTDNYLPYSAVLDGKVIANASANIIKTLVNGQDKTYIQIGTVMTDEGHRNKGLARALVDNIIREYRGKCHGLYLYANDSVLEFYPKLGFEKAWEYSFKKPISPKPVVKRRLNMEDDRDVDRLKKYYACGNRFSDRPMLENDGLLMFYCGAYLKECVYYIEKFDCVAVLSFEGDTMICYDIFGGNSGNMDEILCEIGEKETKIVDFGFMPKDITGCEVEQITDDGQLFVYSQMENMFKEEKVRLPLISHA